MKKIGLAISCLFAANSLFAQTSPLSYDYVEGNLGTGDFFDEDFSFYGLGASFSIDENIFLKGSYYDGATDDDIVFDPLSAGKLEISNYDFGIGYHMPLNQTLDFAASISYVNSELELFGFSENGDGYSVDAGLRFKATERLELNIFADYTDAGSDGETGYLASAYYFLLPTFSVGAVFGGADDLDTVAASVRLHF
jgi:hypothetical protein